MTPGVPAASQDADVIVIGSGLGGLVAGSLLARYGQRVIICESHSIPGGAAHSFSRNGFHFDSGPSFFCGLSDPQSLNPISQVLQALGETVDAIAYDPLGHYHLPEGTLPIYGKLTDYCAAVGQITSTGAIELNNFLQQLLGIYAGLKTIPTLELRADWQAIPWLLSRHPGALLRLLPQVGRLQGSAGTILDQTVQDPWVRRLVDLECFLLSGLTAAGTVAPEMAFMYGERDRTPIDYPIGGSGALVAALVRGLKRWGGELRLRCPVAQINLEQGRATGVTLSSGQTLNAPVVISNVSIWDTYGQLLPDSVRDTLPSARATALATPAVDSFMHLHLGIKADGLDGLTVHHVVLHDGDQPITAPGNTCMISIPSVLDPGLAPSGHHVIHAYTLEPWANWQPFQADSDRTAASKSAYQQLKQQRAEPLYRALERVIPDLRQRITLDLIGTPLTHQRFLRRYQGTYGPGIAAGVGRFPGCKTEIPGLWRVGDSTLPGIGVPAVAASGILCANTLVSPQQTATLLRQIQIGSP
jgi:carotene isomerase